MACLTSSEMLSFAVLKLEEEEKYRFVEDSKPWR